MKRSVTRYHALLGTSLVMVAVITACARNPEPRAGAKSASAGGARESSGASSTVQLVELRGRVVNSGTDHFTITTLAVGDAPATRLGGELRDELRTLAGAEVLVRGVIDTSGPGRSLDVREYELLTIDGKRPRVGRVVVRGGDVWLAATDTLRLVPTLDALLDLRGAKIWVVGASEPGGAGLRVESYGVIARAR